MDVSPEYRGLMKSRARLHEERRLREEEEAKKRRAEIDAAIAREKEERERQARAAFDSGLRAAFFRANPTATEKDWMMMRDDFRRQYMIRNAIAEGVSSEASFYQMIRAEVAAEQRQEAERRRQFNIALGRDWQEAESNAARSNS